MIRDGRKEEFAAILPVGVIVSFVIRSVVSFVSPVFGVELSMLPLFAVGRRLACAFSLYPSGFSGG